MADAPLFLKIAHRGASGHAPENTRAAFLKAIELGADMVELDCQLTLDGAPVVIHDDTLDRTTTGAGAVRAKTLREVKRLDAGSWFAPRFAGEEVLTLEETIPILAGRIGLNLELKGEDDPGKLELVAVGILRQRDFHEQTVISSFSRRRLERVRRIDEELRLAVLVDAGEDWDEALAFASELGAEALHPEKSLVRPELVHRAHDQGLEVRVWSVNDMDEAARLVHAGVDGIFTDFPDRLLYLRVTG